MKNIKFLLFFIFLNLGLNAQSLRLKDHLGKTVNNDTLFYIFHPGSDHGWTELKIEIFVQNISTSQITAGAKKTEYTMQLDEYHAICFGGNCFDSTTFISPLKVTLSPNKIDSSFSGHFRFDDLLHVHGKCKVAYTFYDDLNNSDSAIVYVVYNTLQKSGIHKKIKASPLHLSPNPAARDILVSGANLLENNQKPITLLVYDSFGRIIYSEILSNNFSPFYIDARNWKAGLYYFKIQQEGLNIGSQKLYIVH